MIQNPTVDRISAVVACTNMGIQARWAVGRNGSSNARLWNASNLKGALIAFWKAGAAPEPADMQLVEVLWEEIGCESRTVVAHVQLTSRMNWKTRKRERGLSVLRGTLDDPDNLVYWMRMATEHYEYLRQL